MSPWTAKQAVEHLQQSGYNERKLRGELSNISAAYRDILDDITRMGDEAGFDASEFAAAIREAIADEDGE